MLSFMYFWVYSLIGFVLETVYSFVVTGGFVAKKCFIFSLLCPVYGIGALSIMQATKFCKKSRIATFVVGALTATAVEYVVDFLYDTVFDIRIWNYSNMPLNINGRVCLLFTFFWGILSLVLVYWIHPKIKQYTRMIPQSACTVILIFFLCDAVLTGVVLKTYGQKQALSLLWLLNR